MTAPLVIAEVGVNHNGDLTRAREMVAVAAEAGADYVKFQLFHAEDLVAAGTGTADYQACNTGKSDQLALLRPLELRIGDFEDLADCCNKSGIGFLCTAFDAGQIGRLIEMGVDRIKVPSGELTNMPALRRLAQTGLPILLSTGMATLEEVSDAVTMLCSEGASHITLLQCTSLYPAPMQTLNLRAMVEMAAHFGLPVGFSDHSLGDHAAIAATALGACVIEKHFTLDRSLPGPDHTASLEPDELAAMIKKLHDVAEALGDGVKQPSPQEVETARKVRRSWHAARDLEAGHVIREEDVVLKRPADGLAPNDSPLDRVVMKRLKADAPVLPEHLAAKA